MQDRGIYEYLLMTPELRIVSTEHQDDKDIPSVFSMQIGVGACRIKPHVVCYFALQRMNQGPDKWRMY